MAYNPVLDYELHSRSVLAIKAHILKKSDNTPEGVKNVSRGTKNLLFL